MRKIYMAFFCTLFSLYAYPQVNKIRIEFGTGAALGKWTVYLGKEHTVNMVDRSPLSFSLPVFLTANYAFGKLDAGIKIKNSILFVDKIVGWGHADDTYNIDPLSRNGRVNLLQLMIGVEYPLIHRAGFKLAPRIYAGTFRENSIHPDKKDFGFRSTYELGIKNSWTLNEVDVFITPFYSRLRVPGRTVTINSGPNRSFPGIHHFEK